MGYEHYDVRLWRLGQSLPAGKILLPSQISERVAWRQIKVVREALDFADAAFSVDSLEDMFAQTNTLFGGLKSAVVADPDATVAALQEALRAGRRNRSGHWC
jgi:hypothetical protein